MGLINYVKQVWTDTKDSFTPITAARMNHMEDGIKASCDAWDSVSQLNRFVARYCENSYWAQAGWSAISPGTVGGTGVYGMLLTVMTDGYADNPDGVGTWCIQLAYGNDGTTRRRIRSNGDSWTDWTVS